jgi:hypothetical protein
MTRGSRFWGMGMKLKGHYGVAAAALVAVAGAASAAQQQQVTGPVSVYWMSAATTSGMAGMGAGGAPNASAIMGQMFGGGRGGPPQANHSLTLQLGSSQRPTGGLSADHTAAPALRAGPVLPLLSPERVQPTREPDQTQMPFERPKGRMLIFWGCGEHVGPGQPLTIDFSKIGSGQPIPNMPTINVRPDRAPTADRYASYGEWPNRRSNTAVPPTGSLVGAHTVRGTYTPPIDFTLQPGQDFLPPLNITGQAKMPSGATRVTWNPVQGSTGYFATLMGAGQDRGETIVMWSSSAARGLGWALMDYLPPDEVRRLVTEKVVLPPQATECVVPAEVISQAPMGMLSMIAYGGEANFTYPPRPADPKVAWNRQWTTKVRFKSTTGTMLGMPGGMGGMGGMGDDDDRPPQRGAPNGRYPQGQQQQQPPQQQPRRGIGGGLMRGLGGLGGIPIP